MQLMLKLAKENNQTLIIVTHDRSLASFADKVHYMLDGNIEKTETNNEKSRGIYNEA